MADNPHHPGTAPGQAWAEGYHEGQASNVKGGSKVVKMPKRGAKAKADDDGESSEQDSAMREAAE